MTLTFLLVIEGKPGEGFSAHFPDIPGIYPLGATLKEVKSLASKGAAYLLEDLAAEGRPLPKANSRTDRQIALLLTDKNAESDLQTAVVTVPYDGSKQKAALKVSQVKRLLAQKAAKARST